MILTGILGVIEYLVTNPDVVTKGTAAATALVQSAISLWQAHGSPVEPTEQLQAEWTAAGIDYAAIQAEAEKRGM
jgi:hypothetical protein